MQRRKCVVFATAAIMSIGALGVTALPANATIAPQQHTRASADPMILPLTYVATGRVNANHPITVNATYYKDGMPIQHRVTTADVNEQGEFRSNVPDVVTEPGAYEVSFVLLDGDEAADTKSLGCEVLITTNGQKIAHAEVEDNPAVTCAFTIE